MKEITIDVKGKVLGRAAVEIASALIGKSQADYAPNIIPDVTVKVVNAKDIKIDPKKSIANKYYTHSGYLGSLKERSLGEMLERDREKLIKIVVSGMLPKNKLRSQRLKRLKVS
ncbi:MAG: 50S ribosomal protein L13 [candidate division WS2 bacterium ADurb.Bin280]|uniref:50S ribosomal protein L13 n=1 Tax=candidate division WS2 bacterium ADurb.Bin280 TaxID=1852829 RepID=A0A1V5SBS9_9BACT|nr:MAG: 50S ribosomal protein L13 [candidate division WS2 bacterium ADurb.Bin280]